MSTLKMLGSRLGCSTVMAFALLLAFHLIQILSQVKRVQPPPREGPRRAQDGPGERPAGRRGGCRISILQLFYSVFMMSVYPALRLMELTLEGCQHREVRQTIIFIVFWRCPCRKSSPNSSQSASERPNHYICLLYTSPSPRDRQKSRMPSSA